MPDRDLPPTSDADAALALGVRLMRQGDLDGARISLEAAARSRPGDPDIQLNRAALGAAYLAQGRYAEGWPLIEARIGLRPDLVPLVSPSFPEWRGEPLAGKSILVWVEQGLGDQIMFARFGATLAALGARVTLGCRPSLAALFRTIPGVDEVISVPVGAGVAVPRHDYWSRYFSLPYRLGTTLSTLPSAPYLSALSERPAPTPAARIGLVWRTSPTGAAAARKSLPEPLAQELLALGAVSLHPEDTGARDFADTAAIVAGLDLVIGVDTAAAHLAGAMGKPVRLLLPFDADWRWMRDRADSPWYPSMRLVRQRTPGDWREVVDRVLPEIAPRGQGG
ncbi:hypothetical protein DJ021_14145 [Phenylobacterium hankyongense]|uniref:Uncharacterized protein n=1 Tax=Phenylobacterium hankyongense TaxID=1813876 RepID=A0A328B0F5_9CAUL|nr:hypothetical protein [Phenylobacterium hankyongense]RAK60870.1 hypothetical protein DJ021_14145 [Phenylobacterium hankyongense]